MSMAPAKCVVLPDRIGALVKVSHSRLFGIALVIVVLDQISKVWISASFDYGETLELLPVLNITLHHNTGAAFSFLAGAGGWQRWFFSALALAVSVTLVIWIRRLPPVQWLLGLSLALVLGGAVGNLCDRMLYGYVVDFISVHWQQHYFPTFNVADSAITVGAILMILDIFIGPGEQQNE